MATQTNTDNARLLAAVMFADIAGYTALMQQDEEKAISMRNRQRKVLEKWVNAHNGKIIQYYGDGALIIFNSAVNAVRCAISIQTDLQRTPRVPVRIGIHLGDLVFDDEGVYGDAVNIAARIESLSVPGGILISEKINDEIGNHRSIKTVPAGTFELRNVKGAVKLFAVKNSRLPAQPAGLVKQQQIEQTSAITCMHLIDPFISNINAGIFN